MNIRFIFVLLSMSVFMACSSTPTSPPGAAQARAKFQAIQADPTLAGRAPVVMNEAEAAVRAAEAPRKKSEAALGEHLVQIANGRVDIAQARAQTLYMEEQRTTLKGDADRARLTARTNEADAAHAQNDLLEQQIADLNAKKTDRGLVITLGDVLFASGQATLRSAAYSNLTKLATFLNQHPERTLTIEGHTDSQGSDDYNQSLSQRRADAVRNFLMRNQVASQRLNSIGMGESTPVGDNASDSGRQSNRRVEVIIADAPVR